MMKKENYTISKEQLIEWRNALEEGDLDLIEGQIDDILTGLEVETSRIFKSENDKILVWDRV